MRVSFIVYIMYCRSPHDKDIYVDIFIKNGLAESMKDLTDACLVGIIFHVL